MEVRGRVVNVKSTGKLSGLRKKVRKMAQLEQGGKRSGLKWVKDCLMSML